MIPTGRRLPPSLPPLPRSLAHGRSLERSVNHPDEIPFFPEDDSLALRECEIGHGLSVPPQPLPVLLVRRKIVERDQAPRNVVGPLVGQEVPNQVASTPWNDATPLLSVSPKLSDFERIDLIANEAG